MFKGKNNDKEKRLYFEKGKKYSYNEIEEILISMSAEFLMDWEKKSEEAIDAISREAKELSEETARKIKSVETLQNIVLITSFNSFVFKDKE